MIELTALRPALADPKHTREELLEGFEHTVDPLPDRGPSFFVHPSELCPVAGQHCMYASTMDAKSDQSSLSDLDAECVVEFIDRYHINAPRPVKLQHYANAVTARRTSDLGIRFGLRSIQPDLDVVDQEFATALGGRVEEIDRWNRAIVIGSDRIPITFNVFRESGAAEDLPAEVRARMRAASMMIEDCYSPFETSEHRLSLAPSVNDAIRGSCTPDDGLAVTLNSVMRFWIFTGTAPDRCLRLEDQSFSDAVSYFFADPITHLLVNEGIWALADIVGELDPKRHVAAMAKNDTASLTDDLLGDPRVLASVALIAIHRMRAAGIGDLRPDHPLRALLDTDDMLAACRNALEVAR